MFASGVQPGTLLVVSGPSGVGKSSVVDALLERLEFHFSISATTRPARVGEVDGVDYYFMDTEAFEEAIVAGDFLEWAEYGGHFYGTPRHPVMSRIAAGASVVLDIENEGARQIKLACPIAFLVFLVPPSLDELERRLRRRGDTDEQQIARRLGLVLEQIEDAEANYDLLIVNNEISAVVTQLVGILGP